MIFKITDKNTLISHSIEDTELAAELSEKLAARQVLCKLVNSDFTNQLSDTTGIVVILSESYISQPWIRSILEKDRKDTFGDLILVLVRTDPSVKIPTVFSGGLRCLIMNTYELKEKASSVYLYLKGILKDATDTPLDAARNLM